MTFFAYEVEDLMLYNVNTIQSNLQVQCNPYQNLNGAFAEV